MPGVTGPSEVGVATGAAAGATLGVDRSDFVAMDSNEMTRQAESVGICKEEQQITEGLWLAISIRLS